MPESDDIIVKGERQLLDCLFENLLENAIKYSPEGSTIKIALNASDNKREVSLEDQGPGISPEDLKRFTSERFQRGNANLPGSGIGLSLAYQIASFHGASIRHETVAPQGSIFTVFFSQ
jgi:two-component system sensor histidine kinase TctE